MVQKSCETALTTWPGHAATHCVRGRDMYLRGKREQCVSPPSPPTRLTRVTRGPGGERTYTLIACWNWSLTWHARVGVKR